VCKQLLASAKRNNTATDKYWQTHTVINGKTEQGKTATFVKEDKCCRIKHKMLAFQLILLTALSINMTQLATQWLTQEPQNSSSQTSTKTE
jgi:hypothetical protein